MQDLPQIDGWKTPYVYAQGTNVLHTNYMSVYAACRDQSFDTTYPADFTIYTFLNTDYDQDIIWADGYFVRNPSSFAR